MDAYIIIGHPSSGKSSLVRALTGLRNDGKQLMARKTEAPFNLWAKNSSLQEARVSPQEFIDDIARQKVDAALCTLWPRSCRSHGITYPDAFGYVQAFQAAGWDIQPIVILAINDLQISVSLPDGVRTEVFRNYKTKPFNPLAASVR